MYDLIQAIINHVWDNTMYGSEQQYIYYTCGALIVIYSVFILDKLFDFIINIAKGGK